MKKITIILIVMIIVSSCDEILNPSTDYLIEKEVKPSSEEQVFESGSDFRIVFPPNSTNNNIELKVKKESSAPTFSLSNMKLGSNLYKLSFKGFQSFAKTVNIYLKYDPSKIESGNTAEQSVKGMIYSNGTWKEANFEIDKVNSKIIFNINNLSSSNTKDGPILMADDEIVIGDAYTTTDAGNQDEFLNSLKFYEGSFDFYSIINDTMNYPCGFAYDNLKSDTKGTIVWGGNKFVIQENITRGSVNKVYQITGEIDLKNMLLKNVAIVCEFVGTYSYYSMREFFTATLDNIKLQKVQNPDKSYWIYIDTSPNDEEKENYENFRKCVRTITYKYTNTDSDGKTTTIELKDVNWYQGTNHFYLYLYQNKQQ
ncbi:hypothetical protein MASR1M45_07080 [Candidatus Kapaibacterium sp.]